MAGDAVREAQLAASGIAVSPRSVGGGDQRRQPQQPDNRSRTTAHAGTSGPGFLT